VKAGRRKGNEMRASVFIALLVVALAACALGVPAGDIVEEGLPTKSLYKQQTSIYDEILSEVPEQVLVQAVDAAKTATPADLNADNGTPLDVDPNGVHEEVYRFVQYEFTVAQKQCSNSTGSLPFEVTRTETSVAEGIVYDVDFDYGGSSYSMKVLRDPTGNPHELPGEQEVVRDEFVLVSINPPVCPSLPTWTATEYAQFEGLSMTEFSKKFTGDKAPAAGDFMQVDTSDTKVADIPASFDWRDHMGLSEGMKVKSQGECSSCYATAAASVMSDRYFLASKGRINVDLSAQSVMDCSNGCEGGTASDAFKALLAHKSVPEWCSPYTGVQATGGENRCSNATEYGAVVQGENMATLGIMGQDKADAIAYQVYHYGPVYMRMMVYSDFPYYRSGVYKHQASAQVRGDHAVKLIGFGVEGSTKYWLAQNSWGNKWGEKGFFRIARGEDESGVESRGVFWAIPDVEDTCAEAPACNNGGSFTSTCGCQCADGFSGQTCDVCGATCDGVGFTGALEDDKCACECAPGYFDGDVDGTFVKCGLEIGGAKGVEHHAIATPPCVDAEPDHCPNWATQGYCHKGSKFADYTAMHCEKSCDLCDTKASAQIPVMVQGHLAYQYGDMIVAVPTGEEPWNIAKGWASPAYYSFVCGPETSFEESLYCEDSNPVTLKVATAGAYDVYFFKFEGKNMLGQSKGWTALPKKLAIGACAGEDSDCSFATPPADAPPALSDTQKAEVAQRVADASLSAAQKAKDALAAEKEKFKQVEAEAHNKILKAAKLAHQAEAKKEHAEVKVKAVQRQKETKELKEKVLSTTAKDEAKAREIDAKRSEASKLSKVADDKRHDVVTAIGHHKDVLDKLGEISAQLAAEKAHVDATAKLASKEKDFKVKKAQSMQATKTAQGTMDAQMRKAALLAKEAAEAQDQVKADTISEKKAKQAELKATQKSKESDDAYEINQDYKKKHAATFLVHKDWQNKAIAAEQNVTHAKEVAVAAMEKAQCIIKDHRSGCKTDAWKSHCQTSKWKAWMMTHCTESCGFSCTDLHDLAMGVVLKAEKQLREKQEAARKEACPKYNDITNKYAAYADKYGKMATENVQACEMRKDKQACTEMQRFTSMSKNFEKKHEEFKAKMQNLKCYEYEGQWIGPTGSAIGSAAGQHLLRLAETSVQQDKTLFSESQGPVGA